MKTFKQFLAESATSHNHEADFDKVNEGDASASNGRYVEHTFHSNMDHNAIKRAYIKHIKSGDRITPHNRVTGSSESDGTNSEFLSHAHNGTKGLNVIHEINTKKAPNGGYHHTITQSENQYE